MSQSPSDPRPPVLVTGATSGIGLAVAEHLSRERFRVFGGVLPGEDTHALEATGADPISLDVTDAASLAAARAEIERRLEGMPLWGLVNAAGVVDAAPVELLDMEEARRIFEVNVLGLLAACRTFLPAIRAARGRIVNMSSLSALLAVPFLGPYNASKAAVESLSDTMRRELQPFGVDVIVMQPGVTRTPLWRKAEAIDMKPYRDTPYARAVEKVQRKAVRKGDKGMPPAQVAAEIARALLAEAPPTRIRIQRRLAARLRYILLPLIPDRLIDRMVAKRIWER